MGILPHKQDGVPPIQTWDGVLPVWTWDGVPPSRPGMAYCPHPDMGWGTPLHQQDGAPPGQTWDGVPPCPDLGWGTHPCPDMGWGTILSAGWGTPPHLDLQWVPPTPIQTWDGVHPHKCGQTENITFPQGLDVGGNNFCKMCMTLCSMQTFFSLPGGASRGTVFRMRDTFSHNAFPASSFWRKENETRKLSTISAINSVLNQVIPNPFSS